MEYLHNTTLEILIYLLYNKNPFLLEDYMCYTNSFHGSGSPFKQDIDKHKISFIKSGSYNNIQTGERGLKDFLIQLNKKSGKEKLKKFLEKYITALKNNNLTGENPIPLQKHSLFLAEVFNRTYLDNGKNLPIFLTLNTKQLEEQLPSADSSLIEYVKKPIEIILYFEDKKFIKINDVSLKTTEFKEEGLFIKKTFSIGISVELLIPPDEMLKDFCTEGKKSQQNLKDNKINQKKKDKPDNVHRELIVQSGGYHLFDNRDLEYNGSRTTLPDKNILEIASFVFRQNNENLAEEDKKITVDNIKETVGSKKRSLNYINKSLSKLRVELNRVNPTEYDKLPSLGNKIWQIII